jgi:hypothetical protein
MAGARLTQCAYNARVTFYRSSLKNPQGGNVLCAPLRLSFSAQ